MRLALVPWIIAILFVFLAFAWALPACKFSLPGIGVILERCPVAQSNFESEADQLFAESQRLTEELTWLQLEAMKVATCEDKSRFAERDKAVDDTKGSVSAEGEVNSREAVVSVIDHNSAQDDFFDLYVNGTLIGPIRNPPGGTTSYEVELLPGENIIELRFVQDNNNGTELTIEVSPGSFKKQFVGDGPHNYLIVAPED